MVDVEIIPATTVIDFLLIAVRSPTLDLTHTLFSWDYLAMLPSKILIKPGDLHCINSCEFSKQRAFSAANSFQ